MYIYICWEYHSIIKKKTFLHFTILRFYFSNFQTRRCTYLVCMYMYSYIHRFCIYAHVFPWENKSYPGTWSGNKLALVRDPEPIRPTSSSRSRMRSVPLYYVPVPHILINRKQIYRFVACWWLKKLLVFQASFCCQRSRSTWIVNISQSGVAQKNTHPVQY